MDNSARELSEAETLIIEALLRKNAAALARFSSHAKEYACEQIDEYGSIRLSGGVRVLDETATGPVADGWQSDGAGSSESAPGISIILFAKTGFITELQIYKDDGGPILTKVDPRAIVLV